MDNNRYYGAHENTNSFCLGHPPHPLQTNELICRICGTLASGASIGIYHAKQLLGTGRSGQAYLATHQRSGQPAVIKLFPTDITSSHLWDTARREVRVVTALRHPSILPVFSCSTWFADAQGTIKPTQEMQNPSYGQGTYLLTLCQYIPGSLTNFIAYYQKREALKALHDQGVTPATLIMHLVQQLGSALTTAHTRGVTHGSLVPGNILLTGQNNLWLADFGLGRLHPPTSPYLPPELYGASGMSNQTGDMRHYWNAVKPAGDQYSMAVICQQLFSQLLPPSDYQYLLPVIQRATQQRPEQRYPSIALFVQDLIALTNRTPNYALSGNNHTNGLHSEKSYPNTPAPSATPLPTMKTTFPTGNHPLTSPVSPYQPALPQPQSTPPIPLTPLTPLTNENVEDWEKRGDKLFTRHDYEGALQAYHRAIEVHAARSSLWLALGDTYFAVERHKEALMAYEQAMYLNPNDSEAWSNRGTVLDALGRRQEAMDCYERAEQLQR